MDTPERDVFIVHSKSDEREDALVAALVPRLQASGIQVWLYDDWDWEHRVRRRGRGAPRSSGRLEELDLARHAAGDPMPFRAPVDEVDESTLAQMIHGSRVVLLCEPGDAGPGEGVAAERRVMAGLAAGPILLHLLWPGSAGSFFERLRPAARLELDETSASEGAVDEVFAGVSTAWLVHNLQLKFGRIGGHRLLAKILQGDAVWADETLRDLIQESPQYQEPEERDPRAPPPDPDSIAGMFARMRGFEHSQFDAWWSKDVASLRASAGGLRRNRAAYRLQGLLAEVDGSWRTGFES